MNVSLVPGPRVGTGEVWLPFVQILEEIERLVENPNAEGLEDLEQWITIHQAHFRSLITTKAKNPKDREQIRNSASDTVPPKTDDGTQFFPTPWVVESILLSDVLDMNEFQALDLLVTGEAEVLNYPCWSRGLIAVNMYYEGQNALIAALHLMIRLSPGLTWGSLVSHKVLDILKPFLDNLYVDNMIDKILDLLPRFEVQKQMDILDSNLALGDWRHRTEVLKHLTAIRIELAQIIFCIASQRRITWKDTLRILEHLRHIELKGDVKFYKEDILLITAVLYALDNNLNGENYDKLYVIEFRKYINDAETNKTFFCPELLEFLRLAYHSSVYRFLAETTLNSIGRSTLDMGMETANELLGEDELEFRTDVFSFLKIEIFGNESAELNEEEYVMRKFHSVFTDFINHMPMKLKDMKVRSEDAAKTVLLYLEQGISRPPHLPMEYESFLECMGSFYSQDKDHQLAQTYFSPDTQNISLSKFIRSLCTDSPPMFVCNVKVITGLSISHPSGAFGLIKQNGHNLSLDHFFESIMKYLTTFGTQASIAGPIFQSDGYQRVVFDSMKASLSPHEVNGIIAYVQLIQSVCTEASVKTFFSDTKRNWIKLTLMSTKIKNLPREIRAEMLKAVAAMIPVKNISHETIASLWDIFYSCKLIEPGAGDFRDELEEKETRLESYILSIGFLTLFDALIKARYVAQRDLGFDETIYSDIIGEGESLEPYVAYVGDTVLLKLAYRTHRVISERWTMTSLCLSIFSRLLDAVPVLMIQLLSDSAVLKTVLNVLVECTKVREMSTGKIPHVDKTSLEVLNLIYQVVLRQDTFLRRNAKLVRGAVLHGIHDLIVSMSIVTGQPEYLFALLKFIDKFNPENQRDLALQILTSILTEHSETDENLYAGITSDQRLAMILEYTFAQCLANPNCSEKIKVNILKLLRCSVVHTAPNLGLFLLGVDKRMDFQKTGFDKSRPSRTLLHYILQNCDELPDVFLTLLVLLRDDRLRESLLRLLRTHQFFVKYYVDSFSSAEMGLNDIGYFLKCLSIELKCAPQVGPLAHVLVAQNSSKFLDILERIDLSPNQSEIPLLEFFEQNLVTEAILGCEYMDRELKVKVIDLRRLEDLFEEQINKLEKSTALRLKKSVMGEAKELLEYCRKQNEFRRREASKVILFDCWKQCLEVLILSPATLKLAGMDFVTSVLRLVVDKVTHTEIPCEAFLRLASEAVLSLCGVLNAFKEELSETMLNLILTYLCNWASNEASISVRALLYPSILNIMRIMKDQKKSVTSRTNFALIVDGLCKDCLQSVDTGKITSMYLLGEIIHWSMRSGYGGRVPFVDTTQPFFFGPRKSSSSIYAPLTPSLISKTSINGDKTSLIEDEIEDTYAAGDAGLDWHNISAISPRRSGPTKHLLRSPVHTAKPKQLDISIGDQLNSTALPTDVRDKQYFLPGDWQSAARDESYFGFQGSDTMDVPFEIEELSGFQATTNFAAQTTVMNYMQTKGLTRHLISSLNMEDDLGLLDLFTSPMGSIHLRALLIFGARMYMFSRFARTGPNAAMILLEDSVIPRLTDMHSFRMAARLKLWDPSTLSMSIDGQTTIEARIAQSAISQKAAQLDSLLISVWILFHSIESSLPKNNTVACQIWQFFQTNKDSCVNLLTRCPTNNENDSEVPEPLALFTSLLCKIGHKIPSNSIRPKDDIYDKIIDLLKQMCRKNNLTNAQVQIVKDLLHFLYKYASNPLASGEEKRKVPCRTILMSKMHYKEIEKGDNDGLTVGGVLRLVQLAADKIVQWDGPTDGLSDLIMICEIGLTLVYWHVQIHLTESFPSIHEDADKDQTKATNLQRYLGRYLENVLMKVVADAFEAHDSRSKDYIYTILSRLRRLAHLSRQDLFRKPVNFK